MKNNYCHPLKKHTQEVYDKANYQIINQNGSKNESFQHLSNQGKNQAFDKYTNHLEFLTITNYTAVPYGLQAKNVVRAFDLILSSNFRFVNTLNTIYMNIEWFQPCE